MLEKNKIYNVDATKGLKSLENDSIDCIVTSPPYYMLRDYNMEGQIGLEKTIDEYLDKILQITNECKRVLKKTGTLFWNHGDGYAGNNSRASNGGRAGYENEREGIFKINDVPVKSLLMTPYRLAIRMIDEQGWILRNQIIWEKPNVLPSSVTDRFTIDWEPVFFFTKSKKYYFKQLFEPLKSGDWDAMPPIGGVKKSGGFNSTYSGNTPASNSKGRNKRCVWNITTKGFPGAHFATFNEDLIYPMIEAGCPKNGIVLDPFAGSGTTCVVAWKQHKHFIGFELNKEYCDIAEKRIKPFVSQTRLDYYFNEEKGGNE
jgi:DNA modification methylase